MPGVYTSVARVRRHMPSSLPDAFTDDRFSEWIVEAAGEVDAGVGPTFPTAEGSWKFKDVPDTPAIIQSVTAWLAASIAFAELKTGTRSSRELTDEEKMRRRAETALERIRDGVITVRAVTEGPPIHVDAPERIFDKDYLDQFWSKDTDQQTHEALTDA